MAVRGWMRRLYWTNSSSTLLELDQSLSRQDDDGDTLAYSRADISDDENHDMLSVWCLQICSFNLNDSPHWTILTEEDGNVFKRRGVFQFSNTQHEMWSAELREARLEKMRSWKRYCTFKVL